MRCNTRRACGQILSKIIQIGIIKIVFERTATPYYHKLTINFISKNHIELTLISFPFTPICDESGFADGQQGTEPVAELRAEVGSKAQA